MCVKIVTAEEDHAFDVSRPLEEQVIGCKQIIVNFVPHDPQVEKFLDEIERFTKTGVVCNLNIKVIHNNEILGAKAKRQTNQFKEDMSLNELVKMMALTYDRTDRALEEIFNMCNLSKANVK